MPQPSASDRRQSVRTGVVWDGVRDLLEGDGAFEEKQARIVDIGGGTGGFAVPLAAAGHRVTVVDDKGETVDLSDFLPSAESGEVGEDDVEAAIRETEAKLAAQHAED